MKSALRIIIIEDNPDDALLVTREVEHAGYVVQAQRVQTAEELRDALAQGTWDVVLADYGLPHFSATEGLAILKEIGLDVPFIIVSGCIGEEVAVQLIKDGAAGYVMKDHLSLLGPAVQRELRDAGERRRKRDVERSLAESEERYRVLVESQADLLVKTGPDRRFGYANPTYCALFGKSLQELTNSSYEPAIHPDDLSIVADATDRLFHSPYSCRYEARAMTVGGWRWIEWNARAELDNQGTVVALIGSGRDISDRKQTEEKLRMSELDLQQAQAVAHVGSWRWDIAHDEFVWSDEMCRIFGVAPHAFTGSVQDVIARAIHPDDRALIEESNRAIIEDHNPQPLEYRIVWPDGSVRSVWVKPGEMTLDDKGHASSLTGVVLDITDRKQAEERLAHEGDLMRLTGEMAHVGGWEFDVATGEGTWTDEVARIHGLDPAALTNAGLGVSFYVDESRARIETAIKQAVEHGTPYDLELEIRAANGEHKWVRTRGVPIQKQGKTVQLRGIFQDITERKQADEALKESENRFRAIFDQAAVGVALLNTRTGRYVRINQKYCDLVGYTMQEMLQKSLMDITFDQDIQKNVDNNALLMEGKSKELSFEKRYVHKDGHLVWGNITISPLWKPGEKPQTYFHIAIVENITGRKATEAQLRQAQKMEAIGELAGGVAHDFNNLLTGILGNIALIRSSLLPADPLLENLDAAETAARQAAYLTKGLLTFSRSAVVLPVPINIADALDATLVLLKQSLPATMDVVRDDEQTVWNVLLDQSQMTQILLNLAVNARDAMKGKGILTIRTSNEVVEEDYVQTHPFARTGEFVHLSVTDTGSGIPPVILEHLFEPFHTTKPAGSGTGLGLSIVYGAVKQAGGWITGASTEGVGKNTPYIGQTCSGATFDIYLPRCLEEPVQSFAPSPLSENAGSGTILVVEDEPVVRTVAQALLSRSGYTVLTAPDGASALNVLRDHPAGIGLILLDMTMPGMTTDDIVQAIRALDPTVPILLNSGYTSNDTVQQMLEEGSVQGFLGKPYELRELLSTIDQLMKRT
jgi:PAS domain S-box-containing protein